MQERVFWLSWNNPDHAQLFYLLWKDYHWASAQGEITYILHLRNNTFERSSSFHHYLRQLGRMDEFTPASYVRFADAFRRPGLGQ